MLLKILGNLRRIFTKKKILLVLFLLIIFGFLAALPAFGQEPEPEEQGMIVRFLAWIIEALVSFFGGILLLEVKILLSLAQYNNFIKSTAVTNGWIIVRDLCNMFFIVVLLAISIATILKIEMYHYKKLLGRLVIMVVLINFSKMICGIIIDFAQVLMMTFVNGFSAAAGGNFVQALKLEKIMQIQPGEEVSDFKILGAYLLALMMTLVSCITIGVMIIVLLMRMIMLWILIVLSPLAYFLSTFPQGQKYASQWWSQFGNYVVVGPVMAFFLWLSLISVSSPTPDDLPPPLPGEEGVEQRVTISKVAGESEMIQYIIAIGMLIGGLMITQQFGVMGSSLAGGAVAMMKKYGMGAAKWVAKKPLQLGSYAGAKLYEKTGVELRPTKRLEARRERKEAVKAQREARGMARAAERAARGRTFLGAVLDPRLAKTMTRWEMAKVAIGRPKAEAKIERSAGALAGAARNKMYAVDPFQGYLLEQQTGAKMARAKAKRIEKREKKTREKAKKDMQPLVNQSIDMEKSASNLVKEGVNYDDLEKRRSKIVKEGRNIAGEIRDLEKEPRRTPKQEEDLKRLKGRHAELAKEKSEIEEKINFAVEPHAVGIDNMVKEIENKLRALDTEFKTAAPERKKEIEREHGQLEQRRTNLVEAKGLLEEKEKIDGQIKIAFQPVEVMLKQAEKLRKEAEEKENILKLPYEEQLKAALKRATEVGMAAIMKKIGEATRERKITSDQAKELMGLVAQQFSSEYIAERLEAMLKKQK